MLTQPTKQGILHSNAIIDLIICILYSNLLCIYHLDQRKGKSKTLIVILITQSVIY